MDNTTILKYEEEAQKAYLTILSILDTLASYKVSQSSNTTLYLGVDIDTATSGLGAIWPTMQMVVTIKLMMSELKDKYAGTFVTQFQYLTPKDIDNYHCFSAVNLLESAKLIVSLNKTLKAMKELILQIQKAKTNNFKKAAETAAWTAAWSSFFSPAPGVANVLDTTDSTKDSVDRIQAAIAETTSKVDLALAQDAYAQTTVSSTVSGNITYNLNNLVANVATSPTLSGTGVVVAAAIGGPLGALAVAGVAMGATQSIAQQVNRFNLYLFSKQYPKGTPYCTPFRNKLNAQNLRNSREYSATAAEALSNESSAQSGKSSKGYGATFAATDDFKELVSGVKAKITLLSYKNADMANMYKNQLYSTTQSIKSSSTTDSVKLYVDAIRKLGATVDTQFNKLTNSLTG
jgi:hypothetical protein